MSVLLVMLGIATAITIIYVIDDNSAKRVMEQYCNMECIERRQIKKYR